MPSLRSGLITPNPESHNSKQTNLPSKQPLDNSMATLADTPTSLADETQIKWDLELELLIRSCYPESWDESAGDLASNQSPLRNHVIKHVRFDNSGPGEAPTEITGENIVSAVTVVDDEPKEMGSPGSPIEIIDEEPKGTSSPDSPKTSYKEPNEIGSPESPIEIMNGEPKETGSPEIEMDKEPKGTGSPESPKISDEDAEKGTKPRRNLPRNAAKRSFENFVKSESLWMGKISDDLNETMELADLVLKMSEKVIKRAKTIKSRLAESQKYIRDCGFEEEKVTRSLEKL
ncbi:hypothetical protein G7Y89_g15772 [Cudoniella acicularis]|uniref:Uncharacterized protein n=1 Tax=Cudoniella acicularis TaxID=354080 RepID=A0A8H4VI80_9HELO|nr:hypothetical protein G7Y89_g15772 [Cudoniella acicularis]